MTNDLGDFVRAEVTRAEADLAAFRSGALNVVAIAGGLVALVTGFLSVAAGGATDILPTGARWLVSAAMLAFIGAAACALKLNLPADITAADDDALTDLVENTGRQPDGTSRPRPSWSTT